MTTPTLPAPGAAPTVTVPIDLPVVVTIGGPFQGSELGAIDDMISAFEAANPDVWVEVADVRGDSAQRHDRIVKSLHEGEANVDLYALDDAWLAEFGAKGWLLQLEDYVKSGDVNLGGFPAGAVEAGIIEGHLIALPWIFDGQSLAISAFSQAPDQAFRLAVFLSDQD